MLAGDDHAGFMNSAKHVYCWGLNHRGQIGNGTNVSLTPDATFSNARVSGLTNVIKILMKGNSSYAIGQ
jgi:alpha-tubulin suppressor-like RCC1 family protein